MCDRHHWHLNGDGIVSDLKSMKLRDKENNKNRKKVGLTKWV